MRYEKDKITVIIPVYNVENYLERCLKSVLYNTYTNLEIICVNDGSTDDSKKILEDYSKRDKRVIVINKKNEGVSSARNAGIKIATGEYIAFIDSDDWIHEKYFEYFIRGINTADLAICNYIRSYRNGIGETDDTYRVQPISPIDVLKNKELKSYVWGKLFRHQIVDEIRFCESEKLEDSLYNMDVLLNNKNLKINYVDVPLYYYFVRTGSLVNNIEAYSVLSLAKCFKEYYDKENEVEWKKVLAIEIIKRTLSARYTFTIIKNKNMIRECNALMGQCMNFAGNTKYLILYKFPFLYKAFRILNDPTMLKYEKQCKTGMTGQVDES